MLRSGIVGRQQLTQQTARLHEMELQAVEFRAKFPQPTK
jgi:hypothetical protein